MDAVLRVIELIGAVIVGTGIYAWYQVTFNMVG
jgi:hypothetical protein